MQTILSLIQKIGQKSKKQVSQYRGLLVFPVFCVAALCAVVMEFSFFALFCLIFMIIRVCCLNNKPVLFLCTICMLGSLLFFLPQKQKEESNQRVDVSKVKLLVQPDAYTINGDQLHFQAQLLTKKQDKDQKVQVFYTLNSKEERAFYKNLKKPILMFAIAEKESVEKQRNLNGFDYQKYLRQQGIVTTIRLEKIETIELFSAPIFSFFKQKIKEWRALSIDQIDKIFLKQTRVYMKSLILGYKDSEFEDSQTNFKKLGILHLFSLSGMHVFFFVSIFRYVFLRFGCLKEHVFWLECIFLFFYVVFTGFSISISRAVFQLIILACNRKFHLKLSVLDCWALTLFAGLFYQPYLLFLPSGQLSYGMTFFLLFLKPVLRKLHSTFFQTLFFSLGLTIFSLPFVWFHFFEWNILSFIFTLLLSFFFQYFLLPMLAIFFGLSFVWSDIGKSFFGTGLEKILCLLENSMEFLSRWTFFSSVTGKIPFLFFLLALVMILMLLFYLKKGQQYSRYIFIFCLSFFFIHQGKYMNPFGKIAFVDIGQGDSIFIQLPFFKGNYLIDTGGRVNFKVENWKMRRTTPNSERTLEPFLKSQGVKKLDKVWITHADADHMGDLEHLSQEFFIKELSYPKGADKKENFAKALTTLEKKGTKVSADLQGKTFSNGSYSFFLLYPFKEGKGENNDSLVLYTKIKGTSFLLTGDLEKEGEETLISYYPTLRTDILKVSHHGSKTSTTEKFIQQVQPKEAVISCGKENRFGHPHKETLETLNKYGVKKYRTDESGMVYYEWSFFSSVLSKAKTIR